MDRHQKLIWFLLGYGTFFLVHMVATGDFRRLFYMLCLGVILGSFIDLFLERRAERRKRREDGLWTR